MTETEEDDGWTDTFVGTYAKSRAGLEQRLKAERRAGRTAKQRERTRKVAPKKQLNIRASAETKEQLDRLCERLGKSQTEVIELAVAELAARHPSNGGKQ
jgi:ribbon-helix-helix CopG family protein